MASSSERMNGGDGKDGDGCPPWLDAFLQAAYCKTCSLHTGCHRDECRMFCIDCLGDPFCLYCKMLSHSSHRVIQVRKLANIEVVRASEIQKFIDVSGIQTLITDKEKVVYMNERPDPKPRKTVNNACLTCDRAVQFPFRFCSIVCKLNAMRTGYTNISFSPIPATDDMEDLRTGAESGESSTPEQVQKTNQSSGSTNVEPSPDQKRDGHDCSSSSVDKTNAKNTSDPYDHSNSRKRKGTPRRAPFF